jgi:hypothetical protein
MGVGSTGTSNCAVPIFRVAGTRRGGGRVQVQNRVVASAEADGPAGVDRDTLR